MGAILTTICILLSTIAVVLLTVLCIVCHQVRQLKGRLVANSRTEEHLNSKHARWDSRRLSCDYATIDSETAPVTTPTADKNTKQDEKSLVDKSVQQGSSRLSEDYISIDGEAAPVTAPIADKDAKQAEEPLADEVDTEESTENCAGDDDGATGMSIPVSEHYAALQTSTKDLESVYTKITPRRKDSETSIPSITVDGKVYAVIHKKKS